MIATGEERRTRADAGAVEVRCHNPLITRFGDIQ